MQILRTPRGNRTKKEHSFECPFFYIRLAKIDAPTTVRRPATTMDRLLIAPSTSPISSALAVPSACAAEPMLTPLAMGSVMRKSLHTETAITLPKMPVMMIMATVEENGDINGRFNRMLTNQKAYTFNHQHDSAKSEEEFIEKVAKDSGVQVDSCTFSGVGTARVVETVHFRKNPDKAGNLIYIRPTLVPFMTSNPFSDQIRKLPVEFETIENNSLQLTLAIPDGYTVDEIPGACNYTGCGGDIQFTFFHKMVGNNLMTRLTLNINRVIFSVEEYSDLNQLFGKIAELSNSRIVLKKVN